jgi:hypothetical protein
MWLGSAADHPTTILASIEISLHVAGVCHKHGSRVGEGVHDPPAKFFVIAGKDLRVKI